MVKSPRGLIGWVGRVGMVKQKVDAWNLDDCKVGCLANLVGMDCVVELEVVVVAWQEVCQRILMYSIQHYDSVLEWHEPLE